MIDLHMHSIYSDGTYSPEQLVTKAKEIGLEAIALTDHNTTSGIEEFMACDKTNETEKIAGVEISTEYNGLEFHVLALLLDDEKCTQINSILNIAKENKLISSKNLIKKLKDELNFDVSFEELLNRQKAEVPNRANIASYLMSKGYISSISEGFKTILHENAGYYKPPKRLDTLEVIRYISDIGAVSVLAHPYLTLTGNHLSDFVEKAKKNGLDAIETYYSLYDVETTNNAILLAKQFDLLKSGGSDFHGKNKPHINMGTGCGN